MELRVVGAVLIRAYGADLVEIDPVNACTASLIDLFASKSTECVTYENFYSADPPAASIRLNAELTQHQYMSLIKSRLQDI